MESAPRKNPTCEKARTPEIVGSPSPPAPPALQVGCSPGRKSAKNGVPAARPEETIWMVGDTRRSRPPEPPLSKQG
jgi:hypothetical protein